MDKRDVEVQNKSERVLSCDKNSLMTEINAARVEDQKCPKIRTEPSNLKDFPNITLISDVREDYFRRMPHAKPYDGSKTFK